MCLFTEQVSSLEGLCNDAAGLALVVGGDLERVCDRVDVVAVDDLGEPAERFGALSVRVHIMLVHGLLTLTQTVHIDYVHEVVEFVVARKRHRFPEAALGALSVSAQAEHSIANRVDRVFN